MPSSTLLTRLRQQPVWIALAIFILLCLWVASGSLSAQQQSSESKAISAPIPKVRVTRMYADEVQRQVTLYGRTEPDRLTTLRSEIMAQVIAIHVEEGQSVSKGQELLTLDSNDMVQQLASAKALLKQRLLELQGARSLGQKGYQSQVTLAQAEADVEAAKAQVERLTLNLDNTVIRAPFDGVLNRRFVEVGDLLRDGDNIAEVVDLDPLIITANVTEAHVKQLSVGQTAEGRMVSGDLLKGKIRYIAAVSNVGTNTFPIEVAVDNAAGRFVAGMSSEIAIPFGVTHAIKITPAVMALDESGNLGVKTVQDDIVHFVPIDIVKSDSQGVWLAGLGEQADVITLGHGFVRDGDPVEVVMDTTDLQVGL